MPKTAAPAGAEAVKIERDAAAAGRIRPYHLEAVRDALGLHAATALGYPHEVRPLGEDEPCTKGTATPCNHVGCWFRFDELLHAAHAVLTELRSGVAEGTPRADAAAPTTAHHARPLRHSVSGSYVDAHAAEHAKPENAPSLALSREVCLQLLEQLGVFEFYEKVGSKAAHVELVERPHAMSPLDARDNADGHVVFAKVDNVVVGACWPVAPWPRRCQGHGR